MNKRALIVDDSITIRAMLEQIFSRERDIAVVGIVSDAAGVAGAIRCLSPDVLTLDIAMPGTDGLTLLADLMVSAPLPVVVLSSAVTPGSAAAERALTLGAAACFDKANVVRKAATLVTIVKKARCGTVAAL